MANQVSVINPSYSLPHSITLQINTETGVTYDENDNRLFYIIDHGVLYDDAQNPIVTLYTKVMTLRGRWKVFKGETSDSSKLLFSVKKVKKSKVPLGSTKLNVFLANNQDETKCDFRVIIFGNKISCTVYAGESPTVVAQIENNGGFYVSVNPNVDYAFIVTLLMIVKDMKCDYTENIGPVTVAVKLVSSVFGLSG